MPRVSLFTILDGYEPFDLLRLSRDAFYEVVSEKFQNIEVLDMRLSFITVEDEVLIEAEVFDYREVE
jgi:hypothetical protein